MLEKILAVIMLLGNAGNDFAMKLWENEQSRKIIKALIIVALICLLLPIIWDVLLDTFGADGLKLFLFLSGLALSYLIFKGLPASDDEKTPLNAIDPVAFSYLQRKAKDIYYLFLPYMLAIVLAMPRDGFVVPCDEAQLVVRNGYRVIDEENCRLFYQVDVATSSRPLDTERIKKLARGLISKYFIAGKIALPPVLWNGYYYAPITLIDVTADELHITFELSPTTASVLAWLKGEELYELEVDAPRSTDYLD